MFHVNIYSRCMTVVAAASSCGNSAELTRTVQSTHAKCYSYTRRQYQMQQLPADPFFRSFFPTLRTIVELCMHMYTLLHNRPTRLKILLCHVHVISTVSTSHCVPNPPLTCSSFAYEYI